MGSNGPVRINASKYKKHVAICSADCNALARETEIPKLIHGGNLRSGTLKGTILRVICDPNFLLQGMPDCRW